MIKIISLLHYSPHFFMPQSGIKNNAVVPFCRWATSLTICAWPQDRTQAGMVEQTSTEGRGSLLSTLQSITLEEIILLNMQGWLLRGASVRRRLRLPTALASKHSGHVHALISLDITTSREIALNVRRRKVGCALYILSIYLMKWKYGILSSHIPYRRMRGISDMKCECTQSITLCVKSMFFWGLWFLLLFWAIWLSVSVLSNAVSPLHRFQWINRCKWEVALRQMADPILLSFAGATSVSSVMLLLIFHSRFAWG